MFVLWHFRRENEKVFLFSTIFLVKNLGNIIGLLKTEITVSIPESQVLGFLMLKSVYCSGIKH